MLENKNMKLKKFTVEKKLESGEVIKYEDYIKNLSTVTQTIIDEHGNLNNTTIKDENNKIIFLIHTLIN